MIMISGHFQRTQLEVNIICRPVYVVEYEAPPCYRTILEKEEKELPSYSEVMENTSYL